ncbi:MAG: LuxR C-terminal-related transcriptional regulator [Eggerthellaceae bacterium]|nr:LuxR C-terminal-related transcriptional regulator [Eggerthellaceae bacterium]
MADFEETVASPWTNTTQPGHAELFIRSRISALLAQAAKNNLVVVCAGMGYGKTLAVSDFVRESGIPTIWMQCTEFDNVGLSFWENFTRAIGQINKPLAEECKDLSFPDTEDMRNQYFYLHDRAMSSQWHLTVFDDVHLVKDPDVLEFIEQVIYNSSANHSLILICRELPQINISGLMVRGLVSNISETDLAFTENELAQYLLQQGLSEVIQNLPEIFLDTGGWAFIINFLVRILKKSPGYSGYVRTVMKENVFELMEAEAWNVISERLQRFLVRLSLVNRLSAELVSLLAQGDEGLLDELNEQRVVYLRFDKYTGFYLMHRLFLDYLQSKQDILSPEEINDTYKIAADWCVQNGFNIDAMMYYEKVGDYESFVSILQETPTQLLIGVAQHLIDIFGRIPAEAFDRVESLACVHLQMLMIAGLWRDAIALFKSYEKRFGKLPDDDGFKRRNMAVLYYYCGILRQLMCTVDDKYDFDKCFERASKYRLPLSSVQLHDSYYIGPWIVRVGVSRQGAPQEYLEALSRSVKALTWGDESWMEGRDDLGWGELLFYQGETNAAKLLIASARERAERNRQFVIVYLALFYTLRIAIWQGEYDKAQQALKDMEGQLEDNGFFNRFATYDIALGWYYFALRQPEKVPGWLKGKFIPFLPMNNLENSGNYIKARYHYLTRNYAVLLAFIEEWRQQQSTLFGRLEMLAIEACTRYQAKDHAGAFAALKEAYEAASPNDIVMPFIEMGKDMRTLTLAALHDPSCKIPQPWLKSINLKASLYARHQTLFISEYRKANDINEGVGLTHRETEVLHDLNKGFSRSEIAANQGLSINTVRLVINNIYEKLKARNIADLIRIAHEQKLI